jgi:FAD/FMN-containing dehydrogenase
MSMNLFAYLDTAPSLDDMRATLTVLGLVYRHTLPADDRWDYPMHVFGRADLRVVYHAGNPVHGEAMVDSSTPQDSQQAWVAIHMVLNTIVRRYGGAICDPHEIYRGAVL